LTWALAAATRSLGPDHLGVLIRRGQLAVIYARTGRLAEAERLSTDTAARVERSRGAAHPDCVYALWRLARLHVLRGDRDRAADTCDLGLCRAAIYGVCVTACEAIRMLLLRSCWRWARGRMVGLASL
jgi:hypothetical protein